MPSGEREALIAGGRRCRWELENQPHTRGRIAYCMGLIIRSSGIHAAGCYTTAPIRKGARVAEYTGRRLRKDEADLRYQNSPVTYLFGLGDGSVVIDGHGLAMFINHSCDPNCETSEEDGRVWINAIRDIAAGEEITYDYCLYDGGDEEALCNCGASQCRGTMYAKNGRHRSKPVRNHRNGRSNGRPLQRGNRNGHGNGRSPVESSSNGAAEQARNGQS